MPIKVNLHDNTSQIKVRVSGNDILPVAAGDDIDYKKLEIMIKDEIVARIAEDAHLQEEIDDLFNKAGAYFLSISENEDGSIDISLLAKDETVLDTKTITLTEKIIKSAEVDYDNAKINYTCNDDSIIELDISSIINHIAEALSDIAEIKEDIVEINNELSIINSDISDINLTLSSHASDISILQTTTAEHTEHLSILDTTVEGHGLRLNTLETDMGQVTLSIASLDENKVNKSELYNLAYTHIDPSSLTIEKLDELLVYISKNGVPNYAKLNELGFARIRDYNNASGMSEVADGDLLIDME